MSLTRTLPLRPGKAARAAAAAIWNPDPSDNFWDVGICKDILEISLGYPFFKRYPWDIPNLSYFFNIHWQSLESRYPGLIL
jgi:hypothetical protein